MLHRILAALVGIAVMALLIFFFYLSVTPHAHAQDRPLVDTRDAHDYAQLCANPMKSVTSTGNSETRITSMMLTATSECRVLQLDQMEALSSALKESIKEWREALSNSPTVGANILYGYTLTVLNDRDIEIDFNLGGWEFTHSPYPLMWGGFSYKIPACSKMAVGFISPNTPKYEDVSLNVMFRYNGRLVTEGDGRSSIILPSWPGLHHPGELHIFRLSTDEIESEGCKRD